jgi:hypothetical protein
MENNVTTKETSNNLAVTSFESFKSMEDMLAFGKKIAESRLSPLKTAEDVVAAMLMGKELGMGIMVSINNIYPIEGKASSGIHIIAGQLLKIGIAYEVIYDYEPIFNIAIKTGEDENRKPTFLTVRKAPYSETLKEGEIRGKTIIDYLTSIKFKRKLKQPDGSYIDMEIVSNYYYTDISDSLLTKSNWQNYLKLMMYSRCFTNGAKRIGDDVLLGLYEISELADATKTPYTMTEEGTVTILNKEEIKEKNPKQESNVEEATILEDNKKA